MIFVLADSGISNFQTESSVNQLQNRRKAYETKKERQSFLQRSFISVLNV